MSDDLKAPVSDYVSWLLRHVEDAKALYQVEQDFASGAMTFWQAVPVVYEIIKRLATDFPQTHAASSVPTLCAAAQNDQFIVGKFGDGRLLKILTDLLPLILQFLPK